MRSLSPDVVALIHHVELTGAGWRNRLTEQLVLAALADTPGPKDLQELSNTLAATLSHTVSAGALAEAANRLVGRGTVLRNADSTIVLTQAGSAEIEALRQASVSLSARVSAQFAVLASELCPHMNPDELWLRFTESCLEPLVIELGARTYQFITGTHTDPGSIRSMSAFIDRFHEDDRSSVKVLLDRFLAPNSSDVRHYVLQHLNAHFLGLTASLSDQALTALTGRLKQAVKLRLFLDTNFLFSVLDLHDNPANDAATELIALLKTLRGKLDYTLYVYPLTIDEAKRTLAWYENTLANAYLTPKLGKAALASGAKVSGLILRYLRAVAESKGRITVKDFLAPYLTDPLAVLRAKGVELYNSNLEGLTTRQDVIDDIVDQQSFENERYPERAKPYEALRHDIALWHLVKERRQSSLVSPLDAAYWVVTIDYRFLGFDSHKTRTLPDSLPVCVHPAVLLQMLQLWLPQSDALGAALLKGVRALLPQVFDSAAEQATVRILTSLSRYENVDDLSEDTITHVLLSQALSNRIGSADDVGAQIELVREEIIAQYAATQARLAEERAQKEALQATLSRRDAAIAEAAAMHTVKYGQLAQERDQLATSLEREGSTRRSLENRLATVEDELRRSGEVQVSALREAAALRHKFIFAAAAVLLFAALAWVGPRFAAHLATAYDLPRLRSILSAWTVLASLAMLIVLLLGHRLEHIRETRWFTYAATALKWTIGTLWAVILGLITTYVWERF